MTQEAPKEVEVNFVVNVYKDMEFADEIEFSNSFSNYESALPVYNDLVKHSKGEYLVEINLETTIDGEWDSYLLANNYKESEEK